MKKLEIIIRPERLDDLKTILNSCNAHWDTEARKGINRLTTVLILAVTCFRRLRLKRLSMMIPQKRLLI